MPLTFKMSRNGYDGYGQLDFNPVVYLVLVIYLILQSLTHRESLQIPS